MWTSNRWHLLELEAWVQPDVPVLSKTVSGHIYFWTVLYQLLTSGHGTTFQMCLGLDSLPFQNVKIQLLLRLLHCRMTCLFRAIAKLWPIFWLQLTICSKLQLRKNCSLNDFILSGEICRNVLPHYNLLCILPFCFPPGGFMNIWRVFRQMFMNVHGCTMEGF